MTLQFIESRALKRRRRRDFRRGPLRQSLILTKAIATRLLSAATTATCCASLANRRPAAWPLGAPSLRSAKSCEWPRRGSGDRTRCGSRGRRCVSSHPASSVPPAAPAGHSGRRCRGWQSRRRSRHRRRRVFPAPRERQTGLRQSAPQRLFPARRCAAELIVCGSARSANIRAAVSATIWSLSVCHCRSGLLAVVAAIVRCVGSVGKRPPHRDARGFRRFCWVDRGYHSR